MPCHATEKVAFSGKMSRQLLSVFLPAFLLLVGLASTDESKEIDALRPCYDCEMYNIMQADVPQPQPERQVQRHSQCHFPCQCDARELRCKAGVSMLRDGCSCCYMCARQAGDMCNYKDRCDEARSLYCDFRGSGSGVGGGDWGYCRAKAARPCEVDGKVYKDGEEFKFNCSLLCSCQNGQYACSTLCPQEIRSPSTSHCRDPQLVSVGGRCCKEWVCPHPQSMASPEDEFQPTRSTESPVTSTCRRETTSWSACSVSCGMGVSVRVTNDNADCRPHKQRRLCLVRPCELDDKHFTGRRCRHSRRQETAVHFRYDSCESVRDFRPKYCGSCKRGQCCVPHKTKTISVEFRCSGSDEPVWHRWMWVKNCKCRDESCM